jgi:hypothetical protein
MLIPGASIRPRRICHYQQWSGNRHNGRRSGLLPKLTGAQAYKRIDFLSRKSRDRIATYVDLLVDTSTWKKVYDAASGKYFKFKVNFITLTLQSPQIHTDKEIHTKVFKEFIRAMKRREPGFIYMYKAETQDNGNLHYHLTTNVFMHWRELRNMWNYYCNKLGYVDRSVSSDPNSTDIHSVKKLENIAAYISKYMTKKDIYSRVLDRYHRRYGKRLKASTGPVCEIPKNYFKNIKRRVDIKLWDCSAALKVGTLTMEIPPAVFYDECEQMEAAGAEKFVCEHAIIQRITYKMIMQTNFIRARYLEWISHLREINKKVSADVYI